MKSLALVTCLFVLVAAAPAPPNAATVARRQLPALDHEEIHDEFGQYVFRYVTAEGTVVSERGRLVPTPDGTGYVMVIEGEVSYISDDGKTYVTKYSAGLDGSHIEGEHLPVNVEVEPAVAEVVSQPLAEVIVQPVAEVVAQPVAEVVPQQIVEVVSQPIAEIVAHPVIETIV